MDAAVQRAQETQPVQTEELGKDPTEQFGWLPCQLTLEVACHDSRWETFYG